MEKNDSEKTESTEAAEAISTREEKNGTQEIRNEDDDGPCTVQVEDDIDPRLEGNRALSSVIYESLREYKGHLENEELRETNSLTGMKYIWWCIGLTFFDIVAAFYIYTRHIVTLEAILVVLNALAATSFYLYYQTEDGEYLACKLDFSILSFSVVFPLTFLMQQAFQRREQVLANFADMKALVVSVTMANLLWNFPNPTSKQFDGRKNLPDDFPASVRATNTELLHVLFQYLSMPMVSRARNYVIPRHKEENERIRKLQDKLAQQLSSVYKKMYQHVEVLKNAGLPANEASRINQYHWFIYQRFERLRNFKFYRTPQATRSFGRVYVMVLPWFFGPYFGFVAGLQDSSTTQTNRAFALALSALTFLVLMGLINVARLLEDPFIEAGFDNVMLRHEIATITQAISYFYQQAEIARLELKRASGVSMHAS